jgi:hypothetical protein
MDEPTSDKPCVHFSNWNITPDTCKTINGISQFYLLINANNTWLYLKKNCMNQTVSINITIAENYNVTSSFFKQNQHLKQLASKRKLVDEVFGYI